MNRRSVRRVLRRPLAGEELKARVREVIFSLGLKNEPFRIEKHYPAVELKRMGKLYFFSDRSISDKKKFYDVTAKADLNIISEDLEQRVEDLSFLLSKPPKKGQRVLDIASGSTLTPVIAERLTKAEYHAVDLSKGMLEQSKKLGESSVLKAQGLAEKLPYKSGVFSEVWLENQDMLGDESLKEAHRVLKPGGVFKVVTRVDRQMDKKSFAEDIKRYGFDVEVVQKGELVTITARKKR